MKTILPGILVLAVIAAVIVSGCTQQTTTTTIAQTTTVATTIAPTTASVTIDDGFQPAELTVVKGTTVTWTNVDIVLHTVTSDSGNELKSGSLTRNGTYSHTFNTAGTFAYHCRLHPSMKATVTVTE